jgi:kinesin family protein 18/19
VLGISNWTKQEIESSGPRAMLGCETRLRSMAKLAYSCPKPAAASSSAAAAAGTLPMSSELVDSSPAIAVRQTEVRKTRSRRAMAEDLDMAREDSCNEQLLPVPAGSRIMVYVRMRPMAKSEKEGGARSCVRVVNKKDVYLTEFASETDYLRLKRLKGRHFVFDAAFPDATGQQEVYNVRYA